MRTRTRTRTRNFEMLWTRTRSVRTRTRSVRTRTRSVRTRTRTRTRYFKILWTRARDQGTRTRTLKNFGDDFGDHRLAHSECPGNCKVAVPSNQKPENKVHNFEDWAMDIFLRKLMLSVKLKPECKGKSFSWGYGFSQPSKFF